MTERVRIIAFPGAPNLPLFAAQQEGFFAAEGLAVEIEFTPSSTYQAENMATKAFDVAMTAFDNVVAYGEGQGAAGPGVDPGYVVIMGATQLNLALVVAPDIESFDDLRGRTLALDAKGTGFAFVLSEMLARAGLSPQDVPYEAVGATPQRWEAVKAGEHAGTLTIEPFTTLARRAGFRILQTSNDLFDAYQGGIMAARRNWARDNPGALRGLIRAYLAGLDWAKDPANRDVAARLLQDRMPAIKPQAVDAVMESLLDPASGLTPDGAILRDGMAQVLNLRRRYGPKVDDADDDFERFLELDAYKEIVGERVS